MKGRDTILGAGRRRVLTVIGSRANYGRLKSVIKAIHEHPSLEPRLIVGASALLDRWGCIDVIEREFPVDEKIYTVVDGDVPQTMAATTGMFMIQLANAFERLQPDIVLIHGDRYEMLATATAASYMNIPLAHTEGGDVTGSIDERVRHAITKLADIHFPVTELSRWRIIRMGENPDMVFTVGSTALDTLAGLDLTMKEGLMCDVGVGTKLDRSINSGEYLAVVCHSVTSDFGEMGVQTQKVIDAIRSLRLPTVWLWPNVDSGSDAISEQLRRWREQERPDYVRFIKNLPPEDYARLLYHSACLVGNTSSGIKEGAFLGVPYVCVGNRQGGREHGQNVIFAPYNTTAIVTAIRAQMAHGRYPRGYRFGDGTAGRKIADILATVKVGEKKFVDSRGCACEGRQQGDSSEECLSAVR